jgi:GT2 family glycosyltransferase/glycosyltransferase involved in cell wall biosynthesis
MVPTDIEDVAVLILTYGPDARHKELAKGVLSDGVSPGRLLIVHNPDGSRDGARPWSPAGVTPLIMDRNVGYGDAMNAGVARVLSEGAQWVLLLTHDVRFHHGGLVALLDARHRAEGFGILGPTLLEGQTDRVYSYGGFDDRRNIVRHSTERPDPHQGGIAPCHWVDGCAALIRSDAVAQAGGIRGEFFMYFDETELCLRIRRHGWKVGVVLDSVARTAPGGVSRPASYGYLFCRNGLAYAQLARGRRGVWRGAASQLRLAWEILPKPNQRGFLDFRYQRWALSWLLGIGGGFVAFASGRWGPPPALLLRMGDIRGTSRPSARTESRPDRLMPRTTRVCLVHLGDPRAGIYRYGRQLGRGLRARDELKIEEVDCSFATSSRWRAVQSVLRVSQLARRADVVIVPYTRYHVWHGRGMRVLQAALLHLGCRRRTVTVFHDVYRDPAPKQRVDVETNTLAVHLLLADTVVVHSDEERTRLSGLPKANRVRVVPHFVEAIPPVARGPVRKAYGLARTDFVAGVLGWIHPLKGHSLALEALAQVPEDVQLWFLGGPSPDAAPLVVELTRLAVRLGVADRVTVTGYLPDAELHRRLTAVDVGLCPYVAASASGSLATWLGSRTPVIASDIPVMREHAALVPGGIRLVGAGSSSELAGALRSVRENPAVSRSAFNAVLAARSVEAIAEHYAELCRDTASRRNRRSRQP